MKRLLCKWIPVCAMGAVLCACGGGVADGVEVWNVGSIGR